MAEDTDLGILSPYMLGNETEWRAGLVEGSLEYCRPERVMDGAYLGIGVFQTGL
eukprot:Ihof_evm1s38 gene=Ihof_evmTU1s38